MGQLCRNGQLLDLMVMTAGASVLMAILVPNLFRTRQQDTLNVCQNQLKTLTAAAVKWSDDHQGHPPETLEELLANRPGRSLPYLQRLPMCPLSKASKEPYRYRVVASQMDRAQSFEVACPVGQAHGLADGQPDCSPEKATVGETSADPADDYAWLALLVPGLLSLGISALCFLSSLSRRPEPPPAAQALLDRSLMLTKLSSLGWFLLVSTCAVGLMLLTASWPLFLLRLLAAAFLSGILAEQLVVLGWRMWLVVIPPEVTDPIEEVRLRAEKGLTSVLLPTSRERKVALLVRIGLPLLLLISMVFLPFVEPSRIGSFRLAMIGLSCAALLSWPAVLWADLWSRTLTERVVEWVPGVGQLLEHRLDNTRTRVLGALSEISRWDQTTKGLTLDIQGETFALPPGELACFLAATLASG